MMQRKTAAMAGPVLACLALFSGAAASGRTFNVRDFGAIGDGAADDTLAIQAALDAAGSAFDQPDGGGRSGVAVIFPAGTYVVSNRVELVTTVFPSRGGGIMVRGEGRDSTAIRSRGADGALAFRIGVDSSSMQKNLLQVEGLAFQADAPDAGAAIAVLPHVGNFEEPDEKNLRIRLGIRNVSMAGTAGTNYYRYGFWGSHMMSPLFEDVAFHGLLDNPPPGKGPSLAGIHIEKTYAHNIKDCVVDGAETGIRHYMGGEGNFIGRTTLTNVLTGARIENVPYHVYMSTSGGTLVNSRVSARAYGLWVNYKAHYYVSNNDFHSLAGDAAYADLVFAMSSRCFATGNRFHGGGAQRTGIRVQEGQLAGRSRNTMISDNDFGAFATGVSIGPDVNETMVFNNRFAGATALDDGGSGTFFLAGEPQALANAPTQAKADEPFSWGGSTGTVFSVKDYGAIGDGSTDDSAAIEAAAAAVTAYLEAGSQREAVLHFPAGTYRLTKQIPLAPAGGRRLAIRGDGTASSVIDRYPGDPRGVFAVALPAESRLEVHHLALSPRYNDAGTALRVEQAATPPHRSLHLHNVAFRKASQEYFTVCLEGKRLFQPLVENTVIDMHTNDRDYAVQGTAGIVLSEGAGFECDGLVIGSGLNTGVDIQSNGGDIVFRNRNGINGPDTGLRADAGGGRVAIEATHLNCTTFQLDIADADGVWFHNTQTLNGDIRNTPGRANIRLESCRNVDIRNNAFAKSWPLFSNRERTGIRLDGTSNTNVSIYGNLFEEPGGVSVSTPAGAPGPQVRCNRFSRTDVLDLSGPVSGLVRLHELNGNSGDYYLLKNKATGKYLGATGTGPGETACGETDIVDAVQWKITWSDGSRRYAVENKALGKLLARSGDGVAAGGTADGAATRWNIANRSGGLYTIENALGSTRFLASDGEQVVCSSTDIADESLWEAILAEELVMGLDRMVVEVPSTAWASVAFQQPFHHPPAVFAGGPGCNDDEPVAMRVRNVTTTGFEFRMEEWEYQDGVHAPETASFVAMHKGSYDYKPTLGRLRTEAGTIPAVGTGWVVHSFRVPFAAAPVVLAQRATANDPTVAVVRIRNVTPASFEARLQACDGAGLAAESVDFIALQTGTCQYFEVGRTGGVTDGWTPAEFAGDWPDPGFAGSVQSFNDPGACALRYRALTRSGVEVKVDEEGSGGETLHGAEEAGWIVFESVGSGTEAEVEQLGLVVESPHGTAVPPSGTNYLAYASLLSAEAGPPVFSVATQHVCTGWTGSGSVPPEGAGAATGGFTLLEDSSITWHWATNYWLVAESSAGGAVNVSDGWKAAGSSVAVCAAPFAGYVFAGWSGDTAGDTNSLSMVLPMDRPRSVTANFAPIPTGDGFDWGAGVAGRTSVVHGQGIDGLAVAFGGGAVWSSPSAGGFSGGEGPGNGSYVLGNGVQSNGRMFFPYAPEGMVAATMEFTYENLGSGVTGVWLGFSGDTSQLLNSDNHDKVYVRITGGGAVLMGATAWDGSVATTNIDQNLGSTGIAAGDRFRAVLRLDTVSRMLAVSVSNVTKGTTVSSSIPISWTEGLDLTHFKIDQTGTGLASVCSLAVTKEPRRIEEGFDWGAGVGWRTAVATGQSINNVQVQSGTLSVWSSTTGTNTAFGGTPGPGNGSLILSGNNAFIRTACAATNGTVNASATGRYQSFGSGVRGYWMGFQKLDSGNSLITNDTNDHFMAAFRPTDLNLRVRIGGQTTNALIDKGGWALAEGDLVRMELVLDTVGRTVTAHFQNLTQVGKSATATVDWSAAAYVPDLQLFTVQMTGSARVVLEEVFVAQAEDGPPAFTTFRGTPYAWLDLYYPGLSTPEDYENADLDDGDGDGLAAWQEYIAGTVPTDGASVFAFSAAQGAAGGNFVVTWQSVQGKSYSVSTNRNLIYPDWGTEASGIPGQDGTTSYTTTPAGAAAFFKVEVQ